MFNNYYKWRNIFSTRIREGGVKHVRKYINGIQYIYENIVKGRDVMGSSSCEPMVGWQERM